ncbi:MAG: biotin--[acetyl-CoA-carboxylase] ligase [Acidobacteriota bacterium]|nr:biotin--[acetyl-CoA-carboxylase] ligase [Acidobacteriota bacterium]
MILRLRSTTSTMKEALALAARGEPHGTAVVAEEQTAGVGRHGHSWHSQAGGGLYLSIILRAALPADALPVLTMALGLAVQRAVDDVADVNSDLRWPNDLLLNEKKLAGIMVQAADAPGGKGALIAGMGVNVNQTSFPEDLRGIATSLRLETGRDHSKEALLNRVLTEALRFTTLLAERGRETILKQFEARSSYVSGKAVDVALGDRSISGVTEGLCERGFLRVRTAGGLETIIAGGVRARG